jgi:hypothetical protein
MVVTHHMLPPLHELLVDDFTSIIFATLDVNSLLDDRIRSATECLARTVLLSGGGER